MSVSPLAIERVSEHGCFGGRAAFWRHASAATSTSMSFGIFVPEAAGAGKRRPVLTYLAGLTCTPDTFMTKAGAFRYAAEAGVILVAPDTSPRGEGVPDTPDEWDFGQSAGFYINATQKPWAQHFQMERYVTEELPAVLEANFPVDLARHGLFGHSMGGHGALTLGLKRPDLYQSLSAFAPISNPIDCPWGQKAFSRYLGGTAADWEAHDASVLLSKAKPGAKILVDQGLSDSFLSEQLKPEALERAAAQSDREIEVRRHEGYDHGYYFISTFMADHITHHARLLGA
jgi:S-formylglutathione hydrolase